MPTILETARALAAGETTSRALTEAALDRAQDPSGEGARVFTRLYAERALAEADASDALRSHGIVPSPLAGVPISIKDLFDVRGETTLAGSVVCKDDPPAEADAPIVARLRGAGAVIIGRTNMTEFAFSGLGLNPHYGTPCSPWDRTTGRIPGGSSSGAGVSVADGSVRIPSAVNGVTGFKPTARRVPTAGAYPLSYTLDSIGPLANSVACCAIVDAIMAAEPVAVPEPLPIETLRLAVPQTFVLDGLDVTVAAGFDAALSRLSAAGAGIAEIALAELGEIPKINAKGGLVTAEAYAVHRKRLETDGDRYDPRVGARIEMGATADAADQIDLVRARASLRARVDRVTAGYDALVLPTVPVVPPEIAPLEADDDLYHSANRLMLRNPALFNVLDRCALSLPCHAPGEAPVGLMVVGPTMGDARLLSVGLAIEAALAREPAAGR
jgi:aspartyl-tRNA(Asn)/glutamyl-tRNA(Gln) amidotransferase subunit A